MRLCRHCQWPELRVKSYKQIQYKYSTNSRAYVTHDPANLILLTPLPFLLFFCSFRFVSIMSVLIIRWIARCTLSSDSASFRARTDPRPHVIPSPPIRPSLASSSFLSLPRPSPFPRSPSASPRSPQILPTSPLLPGARHKLVPP